MNWLHIKGVVVENYYNTRRSLEDATDAFFWPTMDLIVWGFMTSYFAGLSGTLPKIIGFLLGGLILWNLVWRAQQDMSIAFLREVWNRNVINLFTTPISTGELLVGTIVTGVVRTMTILILLSTLAWVLWRFNLFTLGFALIPLFANLLLFAWSSGIAVIGLIVRYGMRIQSFAWSILTLVQPVSVVFYPLSTLPPVLQKIAWYMPTAHVFEGMRQVLSGGPFPVTHLVWAFGLNLVYLALTSLLFYRLFEQAREYGSLARLTES